MERTSDRFFLGAEKGGKVYGDDPSQCFSRQNLGRSQFFDVVRRFCVTCVTVGLRGDRANEQVTTHGLTATMATLLINAGYENPIIMLRTGHRNFASLHNYHNLRGKEDNLNHVNYNYKHEGSAKLEEILRYGIWR